MTPKGASDKDKKNLNSIKKVPNSLKMKFDTSSLNVFMMLLNFAFLLKKAVFFIDALGFMHEGLQE